MEILKQGQYEPMPVELQIISIFAAANAHLDDLEVVDVRRFESELQAFLKSQKADIVDALREKAAIDDDLEKSLNDAILEFKKVFAPSK